MLFLVLLTLIPFLASASILLYLLTIEGHIAWPRAERMLTAARSLTATHASVQVERGRG